MTRTGRTHACVLALLLTAAASPARAQATAQPPAQPADPVTLDPAASVDVQPENPQVGEEPQPAGRLGRSGREGRASRRAPAEESARSGGRRSRVAGPTRQSLTFTASALAGYDDNSGMQAGIVEGEAVPTASGFAGSFDGALAYHRGNQLRSWNVGVNGALVSYPAYLSGPAPSGGGSLDGSIALGRSTTMDVGGRFAYDPLFNVLSPAGIGPVTETQGGAPLAGIVDQASIGVNGIVSLVQDMGSNASTTFTYDRSQRYYNAETYADTASDSFAVVERLGASRGLRGRAEYRFSRMESSALIADAVAVTTRTHRIEGGPEYSGELGRGRTSLFFSAGFGAARVESVVSETAEAYATWLPAGSATFRVSNAAGTMSTELAYRRDFSPFQGLTADAYTNDSVTATISRDLASRVRAQFEALYSTWKSPTGELVTTQDMNVFGGRASMHVRLTSSMAATVSYGYYRQRLADSLQLPEGFPAQYDRNAFRVGLSFRLPLVGQSTRRATGPITQ